MDRLKIDTAQLRELGGQLHFVATELQHTESRSDATAEVTGHELVAAALGAFADDWSYRRKKLVEDIASLAEATAGIGEGFERLDTELGATLRGAAR